jgi:hypothetical protein
MESDLWSRPVEDVSEEVLEDVLGDPLCRCVQALFLQAPPTGG